VPSERLGKLSKASGQCSEVRCTAVRSAHNTVCRRYPVTLLPSTLPYSVCCAHPTGTYLPRAPTFSSAAINLPNTPTSWSSRSLSQPARHTPAADVCVGTSVSASSKYPFDKLFSPSSSSPVVFLLPLIVVNTTLQARRLKFLDSRYCTWKISQPHLCESSASQPRVNSGIV
jgi:hypothetical protein